MNKRFSISFTMQSICPMSPYTAHVTLGHQKFKLNEFTHHYISTHSLHSLNVSYTSYKISKKIWLEQKSNGSFLGLLHDLFYYDWRETKFVEGSHAYVHQNCLQNAQKWATISKLEKDIIIKHMWGATIAPARYKESFVVTFVDDYVAIKEWTNWWRWRWKHHKLFKKKN